MATTVHTFPFDETYCEPPTENDNYIRVTLSTHPDKLHQLIKDVDCYLSTIDNPLTETTTELICDVMSMLLCNGLSRHSDLTRTVEYIRGILPYGNHPKIVTYPVLEEDLRYLAILLVNYFDGHLRLSRDAIIHRYSKHDFVLSDWIFEMIPYHLYSALYVKIEW